MATPGSGSDPRVGIQLDATNNTARALSEAEAQIVRLNFANQQAQQIHQKGKRIVDEHEGSLTKLNHSLHEVGRGFSQFERGALHVAAALVALKEGYELVAEGIALVSSKIEQKETLQAARRQYEGLTEAIKGTTAELLKQGKISPAKAAAIQERLADITERRISSGFGAPSANAQAVQQKALSKLAIELADVQRTTDIEETKSADVKLAKNELRLKQIEMTTAALTQERTVENALLEHQFTRQAEIFKQNAEIKKAAVANDANAAKERELIDIDLQSKLLANEKNRQAAVAAVQKLRDDQAKDSVEKQRQLDENAASAQQKFDEADFAAQEAELQSAFDRKLISAEQFHADMLELIRQRTENEIAAIQDIENAETLSQAIRLDERRRIAVLEEQLAKSTLQKEKMDSLKRRQIQESTLAATESMLGSAAQAAKLFGREGFIAYKAFSIAQAIVATALAVVKALAEIPYPANIVAAIAAGAAGAVQIATIVATQPSFERGGYTGEGGRRQVVGFVHAKEFVIPAQVVAQWGAAHFEAYRRGLNPFIDGPVTARPNYSGLFQVGGFAPDTQAVRALPDAITANVGIVNTRQDQRRFLQQEGVTLIVSALNRRGNRLRT